MPLNKTKISLLVADVDGTLLTREKVLTERTRDAARKLREADVRFTITSSRPPRALRKIVDALELTAPIAACNGALFLKSDFIVIKQNLLSAAVANRVVELLESHKLEVWVYTARDWFARAVTPQVEREEKTLRFAPTVVKNFEIAADDTAKIVGVSDDTEALARCERESQREFSGQVYGIRSNVRYLDFTHPNANKGAVIDQLSKMLDVPASEIAAIGDMPVDVPMFERSGLGIAMGNASEDVRRAARYVTTSNDDEGFANAVEQYILGDAEIQI